MPTGELIEAAFLSVEGVELAMESIGIKRETGAKVVNVMSRIKRALGVVKGNRHWVISGKAVMRTSDTLDLDDLEENDTPVNVMVEYEGGSIYQYKGIITGLDEAAEHAGEASRDVEITCVDRTKV